MMLGIVTLVVFAANLEISASPAKKDLSVSTLSYLEKYGYYKKPDKALGSIASKISIRQSIKSMQRFAGIPETGELDIETKNLIKAPRCGLPDMSGNLNTKRRKRYTIAPTRWKKEHLTWKLLNDNNDGLTRQQVEKVMERAFNKWQAVTNLNFRKLEKDSTEKIDIEVKFARYTHNDPYAFDGPGGTLAHAFYPMNNEGLSGDVHFDDDEVFTIDNKRGRDLLWVAVHEIGHSIGLQHSNVRNAIMYPYYRSFKGSDFDLTDDDRIGIQTIYGSRVTGPTKKTTTTKPDPTSTSITTFNGCPSKFKAIFLDKPSQKTYIINDDKVYVLSNTQLKLERGPVHIAKVFPGIERADAAYQETDGTIVLFKDQQYYTYSGVEKARLLKTGSIFSKFRGLKTSVKKIDAIFIWNRNGRTYIFSGKDYYRYDEIRQSIDVNYPREIEAAWRGIPANIDAVFVWKNKATYFFKGTQYYRFDDDKIKVMDKYPRSISPTWTKCYSKLRDDDIPGDSKMNMASVFVSLVMVVIARLFQ